MLHFGTKDRRFFGGYVKIHKGRIDIVILLILAIDVEFVRIYYGNPTSHKKMAPLIGILSF